MDDGDGPVWHVYTRHEMRRFLQLAGEHEEMNLYTVDIHGLECLRDAPSMLGRAITARDDVGATVTNMEDLRHLSLVDVLIDRALTVLIPAVRAAPYDADAGTRLRAYLDAARALGNGTDTEGVVPALVTDLSQAIEDCNQNFFQGEMDYAWFRAELRRVKQQFQYRRARNYVPLP